MDYLQHIGNIEECKLKIKVMLLRCDDSEINGIPYGYAVILGLNSLKAIYFN